MLKQPAYEYFPQHRVTAYQDDSIFWKFYLVPDYVSIRRDFNGNPVFLLIKYAFSDQDREENPELGRGGGYLAFDVEMSVREADQAEIVNILQSRVDQEWHQLKALAEAAGGNVQSARIHTWRNGRSLSLGTGDILLGLHPDAPEAPPGDRPPKVVIAQPTWTEGTFHVSAPQSEALVSHRVVDGKVSLVGNNVVSANMDLTPAGATFMEKTLVDTTGGGDGATDLTPIQVVYNLKFWARIPPVRLRVTADSRSLYAALKEIDHDYDGHSCSEDDMTHYETQMEMAIQSGLINVQLDTGTLDLSDDFVQELRSYALKFVQDLIKDAFYEKKEAPPPAEDGTEDFVSAEKDIYYLKTEVSFEAIHIDYNEEITSIVEWEMNPQGTMQTFFAGLSKDEMKKYVRAIDLDDEFFKTLGLRVSAFANWAGEPIAFVETQIRYEGRDENNQLVEKVETFTFTKDNTTGFWDPSLIGKKRDYDYRWRVGYLGHEPGEFTRWESDRTPILNLSIANPGKIALDVLAGNIDFKQITNQVQVDLSYKDLSSDVEEEATTVVLVDGVMSRQYERYIYTNWDQPLHYRTRFFLKDGQRIESDWQETFSRQLLVNEPHVDRLDVQLVPAGDWSGVIQSVASLRYADVPNNYRTDMAFLLKSKDEFKTWAVLLRDPNKRDFEYKVLTTFQDGTLSETEWIKASGDQALPIVVRHTPRLAVALLPNLLDFKVTPVVTCTLRYDDAMSNIHEVETFTFTNGATSMNWSLPIANNGQHHYSYQITYHRTDGRSVETTPVTTDVESLILPRLVVPEVVCTMNPRMLNFTETPLVEVNIEYRDLDNDLEVAETYIFADATEQKFSLQVHEDSPMAYQLSVTYYLPDGRTITREPVTLDKKQVVIPRYVEM